MSKINMAKKELETQNATCVVIKNDTVYSSHLKGIRPILQWLNQDKDFFRDGDAADKVIGKAAAMLFIYGGIRSVFTEIISEPAVNVLKEHGVACEYNILVPNIINQAGDGICPMESRVLQIQSPRQAYQILCDAVKNK